MYWKTGNMFDFVDTKKEPVFICASSHLNEGKKLITNDREDSLSEITKEHPNVASKLGSMIDNFALPIDHSDKDWMRRYGIVFDRNSNIGAFQVKYHVRDIVDMELVRISAQMLAAFAQAIPCKINIEVPETNGSDDRQFINIVMPIWYKTKICVWTLEYEEDSDELSQ